MTRDVITSDQFLREMDILHGRVAELECEAQECRRSEATFRLAAESLPTATVIVNEQGHILRHRGRVWAEAVPDKGATFFFTLPDNEACNE